MGSATSRVRVERGIYRQPNAHRHHLDRHVAPVLGQRRIALIAVGDVADLLHALRAKGGSAKTSASALATLESVMRFARRQGWIAADPVEMLEHDERPRVERRRQHSPVARAATGCSPPPAASRTDTAT